MRDGHNVHVCLTSSASKFVTPILFESLTGNPCLLDTFEEPERGRIAHIDLARMADLIILAPSTANLLNAVASGTAQNMLTSTVLAATCPIIAAPAMNPAMLENAATQAAIRTLRSRGVVIVEPTEGEVACGEEGRGKLAPNSEILDVARTVLASSQSLTGKKVLITSGPTEEPIDAARVLTNRSSGRMGAALVRAALMMGAEVTCVTGPTETQIPRDADVIRVRTAEQMLDAALPHAKTADFIIGAAAVADYRPANPSKGKLRRSEESISLELVRNPDVIKTLAASAKDGAITCAFAAEPSSALDAAQEKLITKGVSAIAVNDISRTDTGFDSDKNELALLRAGQDPERSGVMSKLACALWLLELLRG
jgi:phosphopantothenoylcysteine decarboxylase/phosphopantothenate--cysteine ligase